MSKYLLFKEDWNKTITYLETLKVIYKTTVATGKYTDSEEYKSDLREIENLEIVIQSIKDAEPIDL